MRNISVWIVLLVLVLCYVPEFAAASDTVTWLHKISKERVHAIYFQGNELMTGVYRVGEGLVNRQLYYVSETDSYVIGFQEGTWKIARIDQLQHALDHGALVAEFESSYESGIPNVLNTVWPKIGSERGKVMECALRDNGFGGFFQTQKACKEPMTSMMHVERVNKYLQAEDHAIRHAAVDALAQMHERACDQAFVDSVSPMMHDINLGVRRQAFAALDDCGDDAKPTEGLAQMVPVSIIRNKVLQLLPEHPTDMVDKLLPWLYDDDRTVGTQSALSILKSSDEVFSAARVEVLTLLRKFPDIPAHFARPLGDILSNSNDDDERRLSFRTLSRFDGYTFDAHVKAIVHILATAQSDHDETHFVLQTLQRVEPAVLQSHADTNIIALQLTSGDAMVRDMTLEILLSLTLNAVIPHAPSIARSLGERRGKNDVCKHALQVFGKLERNVLSENVALMAPLLQDPDESIRMEASMLFVQARGSDLVGVRMQAMQNLQSSPVASIPEDTLLTLLSRATDAERLQAFRVLRNKLGSSALSQHEEIVADLLRVARDTEDKESVKLILLTLGDFAPYIAQKHARDVASQLLSDDPEIRALAMKSLLRLERVDLVPYAQDIAHRLAKDAGDASVCNEALEIFRAFEPPVITMVAFSLEILLDSIDESIRSQAASLIIRTTKDTLGPQRLRALRSLVAVVDISSQTPDLLNLLSNGANDERLLAFRVLHKPGSSTFAGGTDAIVSLLKIPEIDEGSRRDILRIAGDMDRLTVQSYASDLAPQLRNDDPESRSLAMKCLLKLERVDLVPYAQDIAHRLAKDAGDASVCNEAMEIFRAFEPSVITMVASSLEVLLDNINESIRSQAASLIIRTTKDALGPQRSRALRSLVASMDISMQRPDLLNLMSNGTNEERLLAFRVLHRPGSSSLAVDADAIVGLLTIPGVDEGSRRDILSIVGDTDRFTVQSHASVIATQLSDDDFETRSLAMRSLLKLRPAELAPYAEDIAHRLAKDAGSHAVCNETLTIFSSFKPSVIPRIRFALARLLGISDESIRMRAATLILRTPSDELLPQRLVAMRMLENVVAANVSAQEVYLLSLLSNGTNDERLLAFRVLYKHGSDILRGNAGTVVTLLAITSVDSELRKKILTTVRDFLPAGGLHEHVMAITSLLTSSDSDVKSISISILLKLPPAMFAPHSESIALALAQLPEHVSISKDALRKFMSLEPSVIYKVGPTLASLFERADDSIQVLAATLIVRTHGNQLIQERMQALQVLLLFAADISEQTENLTFILSHANATHIERLRAFKLLHKFESRSLFAHSDEIVNLLRTSETDVESRRQILRTLVRFTAIANATVVRAHSRTLASQLSDEDASVRDLVVELLLTLKPAEMASYARVIASSLGRDGTSSEICKKTLSLFASFESSVISEVGVELVPLLRNDNHSIRTMASSLIIKTPSTSIELVEHRLQAMRILEGSAADISEQKDAFVQMLLNATDDERIFAFRILHKHANSTLSAHPALIVQLLAIAPDLEFRNSVLELLHDFASVSVPTELRTPAAVGFIVSQLDVTSTTLRISVLKWLQKLQPDQVSSYATRIAQILTEATVYPDLCYEALRTLMVLRPEQIEAFADVIAQLLNDTNNDEVRTLSLEMFHTLPARTLRDNSVVSAILQELKPRSMSDRARRMSVLAFRILSKLPSATRAGLQKLQTFQPQDAWVHIGFIAPLISKSDSQILELALEIFANLNDYDLSEHVEALARHVFVALERPSDNSAELKFNSTHILAARIVCNLRGDVHSDLRSQALTSFTSAESGASLGKHMSAVLHTAVEAMSRQSTKERLSAFRVVRHFAVEFKDLSPHATTIAQLLHISDASSAMREGILEMLLSFQPDVVEEHNILEAVALQLESEVFSVRSSAIRMFSKLRAESWASFESTLALQLSVDHEEHRVTTLDMLRRSPRFSAQRAASNMMQQLETGLLVAHERTLLDWLSHDDFEVRRDSTLALGKMAASESSVATKSDAQRLDDIVRKLTDAHQQVRYAALTVIAQSSKELLRKWHTQAKQDFDDNAKNSILHVAAYEGHLLACRKLVEAGPAAGVNLNLQNNNDQTPEDVARKRGHIDVVNFLQSQKNFILARGGVGDAYKTAMEDPRWVVRVEWFVIPLPGMAGDWFGLMHSLAVVYVDDDSQHGQNAYVIEKAATVRNGTAGDGEQFKNGVYVSYWPDVAQIIGETKAWSILPGSNMSQKIEAAGLPSKLARFNGHDLNMSTLRNIAVEIGPYSLGTCNCQHAAWVVYNACAKRESRVPEIPNHFEVKFAEWAESLGMNFTHFRSRGVASEYAEFQSQSDVESQSPNSHVLKPGQFPMEGSQRVHNNPSVVSAAQLASWIYLPEMKNSSIVFRNNIDKTLVLRAKLEMTSMGFKREAVKRGETVVFELGGPSLLAGDVVKVNKRFNCNVLMLMMHTADRIQSSRVTLSVGLEGTVSEISDDGAEIMFKDVSGRVLVYHQDIPKLEVTKRRVFVRIHREGILGLTSWRVFEKDVQVYSGQSYDISRSVDSSVTCTPYETLPEGASVQLLRRKDEEGSFVQWSVASLEDTTYVVFQGTKTPLDLLVDLGVPTNDQTPHGLSVHGSMWNSLHQKDDHVVDKVVQQIGTNQQRVILCGHSLGAGYAILVVVPDASNKVWRELNAKTLSFINSYDAVPRMPSCFDWLLQVADAAAGMSIGPIRVSAGISEKIRKQVGNDKKVILKYGTVGTLMFITAGSNSIRAVSSDADYRPVLTIKPEAGWDAFLPFEQHLMQHYVSIIASIFG